MLAASTLSPGQQAAIHELERRVSHLLHDTLHGTFRLVSAPAGLPMPLTEARGWRKGGLSTLDSLLTMAGNSQLTLSSERFSALYQHILRGIAFVWSEQDRAILRREESQASDALSAVLAASASLRHLELVREQYPPPAFHALMNLLSTHDQPRALHRFGDTRIGGPMVDAATVACAKRRLELAVLLQMAYPGAPAIYYGDEVGLTGGDDPYNRAPYPWTDQGGQPDEVLHAQFRRMTAMRQAHPVLRRGTLLAPLVLDAPDDAVMVLARRLGDGPNGGKQATWAITAFNNAETPRTVRVQLPADAPAGAWPAAWGDGPALAAGVVLPVCAKSRELCCSTRRSW